MFELCYKCDVLRVWVLRSAAREEKQYGSDHYVDCRSGCAAVTVVKVETFRGL